MAVTVASFTVLSSVASSAFLAALMLIRYQVPAVRFAATTVPLVYYVENCM